MNTQFINKSHVRKFLLEYAAQNRAHKWTRVSQETLDNINERVRFFCIDHVKRAPSVGKTL